MRAIRIIRSNWLNDQVGGDQNAIRVVEDDMAYEAVVVHEVAVYAPEFDPAGAIPVRHADPELSLEFPGEPKVIDFPGTAADEPGQEFKDQVTEFMDQNDEVLAKLDDAPPALEQPFANAPKAAWIEWAASGDHGQPPITAEDAAKLAKTQLMHRYGGRL